MNERAGGARRPGPDLPYKLICGVEPCPGGWLVAAGKLVGSQLAPEEPRVVKSFRDIVENIPNYTVIAAHIQIGLPSKPMRGGRTCDRQARQILGWPRMAAVSSAPATASLAALNNYDRAAKLNGGHLDVVTWQLLPKIAEVAEVVQPYHQRMLYEVQPELVFHHLNSDHPLKRSKRTPAGVEEREALLRQRVPSSVRVLDAKVRGASKRHLVDACADLWSARRILGKGAIRLPENPEWNDEGLRMEIMR